jgi:hypothetical protein
MTNSSTEFLEFEDPVDDKCVEYLVNRGQIEESEIKVLENAVFMGDKHVFSIMKKNLSVKEQKYYINTIYTSFGLPVKELLQIKQYYKIRFYRSSVWTWIWFIAAMVLAGILVYEKIEMLH